MRVITTVGAIAASLSGDHAELLEDMFTSGQSGHIAPAAVAVAAAAPAAVAVPSLASRVADFLRNDQSGYDWRSAGAIAKELGDVSAEQVASAAQSDSALQSRQSGRGLGLLISLRN